jgi:tetratricopeptide (TPR) repeat protein
MNRFIFLLLILGGVSSASAQSLLLKSGTTEPATGLVRDNDMVMTSIISTTGSVIGKVGFNVSDIAELNLPQPDALATANDLMIKGKYDQALAQIEPVVTYQKTIRDIPGNWWAKAALMDVSALMALNREADAKALVNEISTYSQDPDILAGVNLELALTTNFKSPKDALAAFDAVINQSSDPQTLSRAWVAEGDIHMAQHEFDEAILAYLTVTVFYPTRNPVAPKALWGSGMAYVRFKDLYNAQKTFKALIATYPDSPEAALAQAELIKEQKKT